jgi:hypothetical protein
MAVSAPFKTKRIIDKKTDQIKLNSSFFDLQTKRFFVVFREPERKEKHHGCYP